MTFIHLFILHSVNPYKVLDNLKDIELLILLITYTQNEHITGYILMQNLQKYKYSHQLEEY